MLHPLGKFSYANCNLPSSSLAVDALLARINVNTIIKDR